MQSGLIALVVCCRDPIAIIAIVDEVGSDIGLTQSEKSKIHVFIHE